MHNNPKVLMQYMPQEEGRPSMSEMMQFRPSRKDGSMSKNILIKQVGMSSLLENKIKKPK